MSYADHILEVRGLSKRFVPDGPDVINNLSFDVRRNEIFALLGPSGCGKTTALRILAGLERPDHGTIDLEADRLTGPDIWCPPEKRGIGLVFQEYALFPHLTVIENVAFGLRRLPRGERDVRAREALSIVGLLGLEDRKPDSLSGGQQQRVALARTIAPRPRLVLLDEPFSNLDARLRQATRSEMRAVFKDNGITAILVTHDQEEALSFGDRVGVMWQGRIEQLGTPEEVYYRPRTLFVAQFVGSTNLIMCEGKGKLADSPIGTVPLQRPQNGQVLVALRPEHIALVEEAAGKHVVQGTVRSRFFKGHDITFIVEVGGTEYLVHTDNLIDFAPGDSVNLSVVGTGVVLETASGSPRSS